MKSFSLMQGRQGRLRRNEGLQNGISVIYSKEADCCDILTHEMGDSMSHKRKFLGAALAVICMVSMLMISGYHTTVYASSGYEYVLLNKYTKTMKIGDEYYLIAVTSNWEKAALFFQRYVCRIGKYLR